MFAELQATAARRLANLEVEAQLRARCEAQGLWIGWRPGGPDMLTWALENFPEDLWARSSICPAKSAALLAATSKRVRGLLGRMQRRMPAWVRVARPASMECVARGLPGLLDCCRVVGLDLSGRAITEEGVPSDPVTTKFLAEGATSLAEALRQCTSLASLCLSRNHITAKGATSLAGVLGQCPSLDELDLGGNRIGDAGARSLGEVLGQFTSLTRLMLGGNQIGHEGATSLAQVLGQCSSLVTLDIQNNNIRDGGATSLGRVLGQCPRSRICSLEAVILAMTGRRAWAGRWSSARHLYRWR